MTKSKEILITEIVLAALGILILIAILHYHTPRIIKILETGSIADIEAYIEEAGNKGRAVLILLQIIETVSIVLPALPVYICAGIIYGKLEGFLMCYITNVVMNALIFTVARKFKLTTSEFISAERNARIEMWMQKAKRMDRVVVLMCFLPVVPNGMIPYISAQTPISLKLFMKALAIGCAPAIFFYVCGGDLLISHSFHITWPVLLAAAVLTALILIFRKPLTKWLEPKVKKFLTE